MSDEKPVLLTDEDEIASAETNALGDIIAAPVTLRGKIYWVADPWSLKDWRDRQRVSFTDGGDHE